MLNDLLAESLTPEGNSGKMTIAENDYCGKQYL
jgi:hypothetical protein